MKKSNFVLFLSIALSLLGCNDENSPSTRSSSSSKEEKGDIGYRYLRSDLLAFRDYSNMEILDRAFSFEESFKNAYVSKGIFGDEEPHFLSIASKKSKISIAPEEVKTDLEGMKESSFRNLKFKNSVQNADISMENVDSSFLFEGTECSLDSYLKDGVFYANPNEDAYRFLKWGMKYILPKYGYDTSSYELPRNGLKKTFSKEAIEDIDRSGLLPASKSLSMVLPSFLNALLESEASLSQSYEIFAGKPLYYFDAVLDDLVKPVRKMVDDILSFSFEGEEWASIVKALEEKVSPFLETVSSSSLSLRIVYDKKALQRTSLECRLSFDQKKMESYILSLPEVEVGETTIPLSLTLKAKPSLYFDGTTAIAFPDFSRYEEFEMPPKNNIL